MEVNDNHEVWKYVRFRRLYFMTQVENQSIKNDDRFPEKGINAQAITE